MGFGFSGLLGLGLYLLIAVGEGAMEWWWGKEIDEK